MSDLWLLAAAATAMPCIIVTARESGPGVGGSAVALSTSEDRIIAGEMAMWGKQSATDKCSLTSAVALSTDTLISLTRRTWGGQEVTRVSLYCTEGRLWA